MPILALDWLRWRTVVAGVPLSGALLSAPVGAVGFWIR